MNSANRMGSDQAVLPFRDRAEAGHLLAAKICRDLKPEGTIIAALPRGGVPVAFEIALHLGSPLDVLAVRKVGAPSRPELALAAVATGGVIIADNDLAASLGISQREVTHLIAEKQRELQEFESAFRPAHPALPLKDQTVVLVDDGAATGSSMLAAIASARVQGAKQVIVAVPVASPEAAAQFLRSADKFIAVACPRHFIAVGEWYRSFPQVSDESVERLLAHCASGLGKHSPIAAAEFG